MEPDQGELELATEEWNQIKVSWNWIAEEWNQIKVSWSFGDRGVKTDQGELEPATESGTRLR